ncbi:hypothetical protein F2Q68_00027978 [Brassica cretica]|uniref:Phorbol-ester/DAG-type domain-containing protein n=1 Tax=Brassica cretica TaxID=69181 RepID=A0A8S9IKL5_BRACR|nr:hypothetical protein F2Q68_00027978 [Brassica cretica]
MDVVGEFHKEKNYIVYHHPKYHPVPQIQSPSSSGEKSINKQPIFLCPNARSNVAEAKSRRESPYFYEDNFPLISSPEYLFSRKSYYNHSVLPLFWCNNKEFDADDGKYEWDGKDLENVSEEDDITPDVGPFDMISEGKILHFLHVHHLYLQVSIAYDENKFCQACILPIFEGNFYSCIECDFILHETCAKSHRKIQHALHPHLLTLKLMSLYESNLLMCDACGRFSGGFVYACDLEECHFNLDILCASISEPLDYQDHQHPLFDICFICITLPSIISYKHDKHVLKAMLEKPESRESWCEVCEHYLSDIDTCVVYGCDECCTTFHVECLFGHDPYVRFGQQCEVDGIKFQVLRKSNTSRPFCNSCKQRCQHKIFKRHNFIACSVRCVLRNL